MELLAKKREIALHGVLAVCNGNVEPRKFAEAENLQWWWLVRRRRSRRSGARGSLHGPGCAPVVARFFCLKEPPNRNRSGARIPPSTATPFAVHPDAWQKRLRGGGGSDRTRDDADDGDDGGNDCGGAVQLFGWTRRVSQSTILKKNSAFGGGRQQRGIVTRQRQRGPSESV